ncbi:3-oxoacyl-[acyl-carrier protein] reductase [Streptomyces sp. yr375]|uniref:SDR family oxidoreductase n=1 Tax=Streptomyces sp. yr375 TaxID=1761906 RepID=UPI0008D31491|nr:SDR family oxidoreductase [Streptomyces sp. yr375]SEQ41769.1 3-oxoacyl-[acyl-carrier protein] reductase [Streptomyces sp. yr375]
MTGVESPVYEPGHGLLRGRTAVITAAAGAGIGGATARRFLEEGAQVLISDAHARRLKEHETELAAEFPGAVAGIPCDVTDDTQVQALFDTAVRLHGRLDIVVNNAGLGGTSDLVDMTDDQWSRVLDVTLNGTFRCTRAALRLMRGTGGSNGGSGGSGTGGGSGGVIVNNASVVGWRAQAGQAHYAAAKAGVMALTRCAAIEAAAYGVRVNAVSPSLAMHPHLVKVTTPELLAELTAREAFGRYAEPWEVANVIVFLASGYSSYLTGEIVSVSSQHA